MSLSLRDEIKIAIDETMLSHWLVRTSPLTEQETSGVRNITEGSTGLTAVKKGIWQTIGARRRQEVRDDRREQEDRALNKTGSAGDNVHTSSDGEETESETEESLDDQDLWYVMRSNGWTAARKKLQQAQTSRRLLQEG